MKVIEQVIEFARGFKNKGYDLEYQPETKSGLVQVYIDLKRKGKVIVSGPFETLQTIMKVLENN